MEKEENLKIKNISVVTKEGRIISIHDAEQDEENCCISKGWTVLSKPLAEG